jgi:glycerol-3-phosphate O-acyltransferase/dihydroxyacetone phosphate acyltransferase
LTPGPGWDRVYLASPTTVSNLIRMTADRFMGAVARLVLEIFFREVEVVGAERIPAGRPLVLVANHVNGLIDPLLLLGPLPVMPRFLAKSTLWKIAPVRPFLDLAGAIPVYRRQDEGSNPSKFDPGKNAETFTRAEELLAKGGALALFPEGTSHSDPSLKPLKTGAPAPASRSCPWGCSSTPSRPSARGRWCR